jgi:hypothetical protein
MKEQHMSTWLEENIQDFLDAPTKRQAIEAIGYPIMKTVDSLMELENIDKSSGKREYISNRVKDLEGSVNSKTQSKTARAACQKSKRIWTAIEQFSDLYYDQLLMTDSEVGKALESKAILNAFPNSKHHCYHGVGVEVLVNLDLWMDHRESETATAAATEEEKS